MSDADPLQEVLDMKDDIGNIKESVGTLVGQMDQYIKSQDTICKMQSNEIKRIGKQSQKNTDSVALLQIQDVQGQSEVMDYIDDACEQFQEDIEEHKQNEGVHFKDPKQEGMTGYIARRWYIVIPAFLGGIGALASALALLINKILEVWSG